jgi:hypothetical protein
LTDSIFNTPLPYLLCGTSLGVWLVGMRSWLRWWHRLLICAAAPCGVVAALESAAPDPLLWSDRLVVGGAVLGGIAAGAVPAAYVSWMRRVFRVANARVIAKP